MWAPDGPGRGSTTTRHASEVSSCRTPIRHPRWARWTSATPTRQANPQSLPATCHSERIPCHSERALLSFRAQPRNLRPSPRNTFAPPAPRRCYVVNVGLCGVAMTYAVTANGRYSSLGFARDDSERRPGMTMKWRPGMTVTERPYLSFRTHTLPFRTHTLSFRARFTIVPSEAEEPEPVVPTTNDQINCQPP